MQYVYYYFYVNKHLKKDTKGGRIIYFFIQKTRQISVLLFWQTLLYILLGPLIGGLTLLRVNNQSKVSKKTKQKKVTKKVQCMI